MTTYQHLLWADRIKDTNLFLADMQDLSKYHWVEWTKWNDEFIAMCHRSLEVARIDGRQDDADKLENSIEHAEAIGERLFASGVAKGYHR